MDETADDAAIQAILEEGPRLLQTAQLARHVSTFWKNVQASDMSKSVRTLLTKHFMDICCGEEEWDDVDPEDEDE